MRRCFGESQDILMGERFSVNYDSVTLTIQELARKASVASKVDTVGKISYFSDFIFIQKLMALEIDIKMCMTNATLQMFEDLGRSHQPNGRRKSSVNTRSFDMILKGTNMQRIKLLEKEIVQFVNIFCKYKLNTIEEMVEDQEQKLDQMEQFERFGLHLFKQNHLFQYLSYLKGLLLEQEVGDFYGAKQHYLISLTKTSSVNHRIKKETLFRLMNINKKMGLKETPEKALLSKYYIKQKYVQILFDSSSFPNSKILKSTMALPKMLFNSLNDRDFFGLKILKNGFNHDEAQLNGSSNTYEKLTQSSKQYVQDVIALEQVSYNTSVKARFIDDFTEDLQAFSKSSKYNRISGKDV